jgi:conflict system STAND superfamily ATPase
MTAFTEGPPIPESPYRGIESFRYIDQQIFSARDDETWDLLSNILIYRGVLLYGDSGSGKSSLINAGLIPAALRENLIANRLRIQPRRGKEIKIERIPTEFDDKPPYMPSIFIDKGSNRDELLSLEISLEDFYQRLDMLGKVANRGPRPLLIFDQFEEFITLFEEALRGGETSDAKRAQAEVPEVQQSVLDTLTRLMEDEALPVKLLFVFREDYLAKLNRLFESCPDLLNQYVRLLPPRVEEAKTIIRAPFLSEDLKRNFIGEATGKGGKEIPEELAQDIATQLQERSESGFINLSELQIVCRKLWESPSPVEFFEEKHGNIQEILEDHWADVLTKLGALYDAAIALLGHMVTSSNTRNIISEPDLKSNEKDNFTTERIDAALEALVERKLVRREPRHKIYFYEIASEFLVPWIQQKKAARRSDIQARKLAAEAEQKLRQSEKQKRSLLIGAIVLGSLLVISIGLGVYSVIAHKGAERAFRSADQAHKELQVEKDRSDKIIKGLNDLLDPDAQVRLDAVNALIALDQNNELPRDLVPVILGVTSKDEKTISDAASYFFPSALQEAKTSLTASILRSAEETTAVADTNKLPPRVYLQIASKEQRPRADKIAGALRGIGFIVPAYELVDSRHAPSTNQLRYYKSTDGSSGPDPNRILQTIKNADGPSWSVAVLNSSSSVRPGHFEVWFAKDTPEDNANPGEITDIEVTPDPNSPAELKVRVSYEYKGDQVNQIIYISVYAFQKDGKIIRTSYSPNIIEPGKHTTGVVLTKTGGVGTATIAKIRACLKIASGPESACKTRDYDMEWK